VKGALGDVLEQAMREAAQDLAAEARKARQAREAETGVDVGDDDEIDVFPWIWARPPRGGRGRGGGRRRQPRSREEIVATALYLADNEGFDAVTMRRVASELGLGTMSLYWYVESRDDLLDLMFDEIMGEQLLPEPVPSDWRDALRAIAHAAKKTYERHPWLGGRMGDRPGFSPNMIRHAEQSMAAVAGLGLDPVSSMQVLQAVDDYVIGHITRTQARNALGDKVGFAKDDYDQLFVPWLERVFASGDFPHLAAMHEHPEGFAAMVTDTFDPGLEFVLDGIELRFGGDHGEPPREKKKSKGKKSKT
jgi:AcrR family transcriptional regulator